MNSTKTRRILGAAVALLAIGAAAGCGAGTNTSIATVTTPAGVLKLAVGTFNDAFGTWFGGGVFLNAVATFRNQFGNSAYENPGKAVLTVPGGGTVTIGAGLTGASGSGRDIYSYGQKPFVNSLAGFPPAFSPFNTSFGGGYATGFLVNSSFGPLPSPAAGSYTLTSAVPVNGTIQNYSASATLPSAFITLGADGGVTGFTSDGAGGGTFTLAPPPSGVTESLVAVFDSSFNEVATTETTGTSATLPSGTLAPGSYFTVVFGADFPFVESAAPNNHQQSPTLSGSGGTADLTVSTVNGPFASP